MFNIVEKSIDWSGRKLTIQSGKVARQADGAVVAQYGGTAVLCAVTFAKEPKSGIDFLPLTVNYKEMAAAAGKIPGGFFKREGKQSEKEVLTSRLIDRPIRPLFPEGFFNEVQVLCTLLSYDPSCEPDVVALVAAMAAIKIAGLPVADSICGVKIALLNDEFVVNPTLEQIKTADLDLTVAATKNGILMVESEAKELSEEIMLKALNFAHESIKPILSFVEDFVSSNNVTKFEFEQDKARAKLKKDVATMLSDKIAKSYSILNKKERTAAINELKTLASAKFVDEKSEDAEKQKILLKSVFKEVESEVVRGSTLKGKRIDGRKKDQVRQINVELDLFEMPHGTALFTRGETQALAMVTLGGGSDEQLIDAIEGSYKEPFMLHYNFPPYSVGEVGALRAPGRREIGHGKLAYKAVKGVLPGKDKFPYTIRIVSEITESNGSSSMATVCASSLALMAAGVPVSKAVAGIAMGLIKEKDEFIVLSDIMGDEDHLGDMDFKVAGTKDGITALQMDIKTDNVSSEIMEIALNQAKEGRMHILSKMAEVIEMPRGSLSNSAPKISTVMVPVDKIAEVIGKQGKVIKGIIEKTGAQIEIEDDGTVKILSNNADAIKMAEQIVAEIVTEVREGNIYAGQVCDILPSGALVMFAGSKKGRVHISEVTGSRIGKVEDVLSVGDSVNVKVMQVDGRGRFELSMVGLNDNIGSGSKENKSESGESSDSNGDEDSSFPASDDFVKKINSSEEGFSDDSSRGSRRPSSGSGFGRRERDGGGYGGRARREDRGGDGYQDRRRDSRDDRRFSRSEDREDSGRRSFDRDFSRDGGRESDRGGDDRRRDDRRERRDDGFERRGRDDGDNRRDYRDDRRDSGNRESSRVSDERGRGNDYDGDKYPEMSFDYSPKPRGGGGNGSFRRKRQP